MTDVKVADMNVARAAVVATYGGIARWPGNTDGVNDRGHLVVPYRMNVRSDGTTAFDDTAGAREYIKEAMDQVGTEYMNGCIEFVDDTDTQG